MHYFSIVFTNFKKPCVNFVCSFGRNRKLLGNFEKILKIFDENSMEKLNFFIFIFENLLLKIEPLEITPFYYNNFFGFGGGIFPLSPWPLGGGVYITVQGVTSQYKYDKNK